MARARNIKPGFFTNDELAECSPYARLLFAGLWTIADREGRLEDRPKRIKALVLPFDDVDCNDLLQQLHEHGFILRYEANGNGYIQVQTWSRHQNPHVKESASTIPAPCNTNTLTEEEPEKHHTSTVQEPEENTTNPADSLNLNPDTLCNGENPPPSQEAKATDTCPHQQIIDLYHEILPVARRIRDWTPSRQAVLRARWREDKKRQDLDWWRKFFEYIATCDFLMGRVSTPGRAPFEISLDWILTPSKFIKIIEGGYENREVAA